MPITKTGGWAFNESLRMAADLGWRDSLLKSFATASAIAATIALHRSGNLTDAEHRILVEAAGLDPSKEHNLSVLNSRRGTIAATGGVALAEMIRRLGPGLGKPQVELVGRLLKLPVGILAAFIATSKYSKARAMELLAEAEKRNGNSKDSKLG